MRGSTSTVDLEPRVADLGEPVAAFVDEVEREPVRRRCGAARARRAAAATFSPGSTVRASGAQISPQTIALPRSSSQW